MHRGIRLLITWYVGLVMGTRGEGSSFAQSLAQDGLASSVPAELRAWIEKAAPPPLPPGSYPVDQLTAVLPPSCRPAARH